MTRRIYCETCGVLKPMHPEDVMAGFQRRRVELRAKKPDVHQIQVNKKTFNLQSLICDNCGNQIPDGAKAIAETMWRDGITPWDWEQDYMEPKTETKP